ncbi:MAG: helicase [Bacteroidetes bacterium]|nr:helicase [Bacteroidota bacterium]
MEENKAQQNEIIISNESFELGTIARIGDKHYQYLEAFDFSKKWVLREIPALKQDNFDFSKESKYHGFTVEPNFINHESVINNLVNLSEGLVYEPEEGEFPNTKMLFEHIFGEQIELGYDRFSIILKHPKHIQPILVLASNIQATGKTTFLNYIDAFFKGNSITMNISVYKDKFNSSYATKLCINIDETIISEDFLKERLKQNTTSGTINLRLMHKDFSVIPFYGKFTMCTNNELDFAKIEENDQRFWIRKPGKINNFDPDFAKKLVNEIPHFLYFLLNRELSVPKPLGRLWFPNEMLQTDALADVVNNSKSDCAKDIEIYFEEQLDKQNRDTIGATATEICDFLNNKYKIYQISNTLKHELKMDNKNRQYQDLRNFTQNGRPYIFTRTIDKDLPY